MCFCSHISHFSFPISNRVIRVFGTTSTNDLAWREGPARGADFLAVAADVQTAGRGRHGRSWHASPGKDLLFSVFLRPPRALAPAGVVTALGAVAVCEALERNPEFQVLSPEPKNTSTRHSALTTQHSALKIRWPNDLYVGGKKLCGILAESREIAGCAAYVVGIGLNVNSGPEDWPEEIRETATSLLCQTGRPTDRGRLLTTILDRFRELYAQAAAGNTALLEAAWQNASDLPGKRVRVDAAGRLVQGTVLSAGFSEGITLALDEGRRLAFAAEHVTRVEVD